MFAGVATEDLVMCGATGFFARFVVGIEALWVIVWVVAGADFVIGSVAWVAVIPIAD